MGFSLEWDDDKDFVKALVAATHTAAAAQQRTNGIPECAPPEQKSEAPAQSQQAARQQQRIPDEQEGGPQHYGASARQAQPISQVDVDSSLLHKSYYPSFL